MLNYFLNGAASNENATQNGTYVTDSNPNSADKSKLIQDTA